jgi:hypothetical protein
MGEGNTAELVSSFGTEGQRGSLFIEGWDLAWNRNVAYQLLPLSEQLEKREYSATNWMGK